MVHVTVKQPITPPKRVSEPASHSHAPSHLSQETPLKIRTTDSPQFRGGTLDQKRQIVIEDLKSMVPEVEVNWFFEHVLPKPIEGFNVEKVVKRLKRDGMITKKGWKNFAMEPKKQKDIEDVVYSSLQPIFGGVVAATKAEYPNATQKFTLIMRPNHTPFSERASTSRPDASVVPVEVAERFKSDEKAPYTWYDISGTAQFKKAEESSTKHRNDNIFKQVYDLHHLMAIDPCRRFTIGFTMQNRQMRGWFACRGVVLVTKPFDVSTNPEQLVHFFVSLAFASRTALGWDPTIQHIPEASSPGFRNYRITVEGKAYTTVRNLADYSADSLVSRATRVWLVQDERGEQYVLKDVWLDTDRLPEDEIRAKLLGDVLEKCGEVDRDTLLKHILTPRAAERMMIDGANDTTDGMMSNEKLLPSSALNLNLEQFVDIRSQSVHPSNPTSQALSGPSAGTEVAAPKVNPSNIIIRSKYHYRVLFQEHGTDLYNETSLHNVFKTLADLLTVLIEDRPPALEIIQRSGWVHRDISCGNVYWFKDSAGTRGLLGDFEYAKRVQDPIEHRQRTGTLQFMASEAASHKWSFTRPPRRPYGAPPLTLAPFAHNPLHDLESLWWLLVYVLFYREDADNFVTQPDQALTRENQARPLFIARPETGSRRDFLSNMDSVHMESIGVASSFEPVLAVVRNMASDLVSAYWDAEAPYSEIDLTKCLIHSDLRPHLTFQATIEAIKNIKLTSSSVRLGTGAAPAIGSGKRKNASRCGDDILQIHGEERKSKRTRTS
ncbi:hypothetical protein D9757_003221 [Collybiopsis confluens]|uniref:Fungal-type protein kinase domain-containing protein n=1 Tax=Collybiopsis confluens TaxID=2823264 RepID=A0A8H5MFI8_9AGAR|nr:hypothetical protein D9757_003221 [Collybiopsis confluens]